MFALFSLEVTLLVVFVVFFWLSDECDIVAVDAYVDTFPVLAVAFAQVVNPL